MARNNGRNCGVMNLCVLDLDVLGEICSFLNVMNASVFYNVVHDKYHDEASTTSSGGSRKHLYAILKQIFPIMYSYCKQDETVTSDGLIMPIPNMIGNIQKPLLAQWMNELSEISFMLYILDRLKELQSHITFNSLPPLPVKHFNHSLYKECEHHIQTIERIKNDYLIRKIKIEDLSEFTINLDRMALFIGHVLSHFHTKAKSLSDPYGLILSCVPFLRKVKSTLLSPYDINKLIQTYKIPVRTSNMVQAVKQFEGFRNNKYLLSFYHATYGHAIHMNIVRLTEFEVLDEDLTTSLLWSFRSNSIRDLHIWIDFRRVKNEKLLFDQLTKILSGCNNGLHLLFLDLNYYTEEEQVVRCVEILDKVKKSISHISISIFSELKEHAIVPHENKKHFDFTHEIKHLTLIDKNNYNLLNRTILKNTLPNNESSSRLEHVTIAHIDHLHAFLNNHTNMKRIDFFSQHTTTSSDTFHDTNLITLSIANLKQLSTVYIDDRNESLGYSMLNNLGPFVKQVIFKYSKNAYTLSSLIEGAKKESKRLNKLTILDNTNSATNLQLFTKTVLSFLLDNMLDQLAIHTKSYLLLNEFAKNIQKAFTPNELELKYLQINKRGSFMEFVIYLGKANSSNCADITIIHTMPFSGDTRDELLQKREEIETVLYNVYLLGRTNTSSQESPDLIYNHYQFHRFLHSLSFSSSLTLTRSALHQLMIIQ